MAITKRAKAARVKWAEERRAAQQANFFGPSSPTGGSRPTWADKPHAANGARTTDKAAS